MMTRKIIIRPTVIIVKKLNALTCTSVQLERGGRLLVGLLLGLIRQGRRLLLGLLGRGGSLLIGLLLGLTRRCGSLLLGLLGWGGSLLVGRLLGLMRQGGSLLLGLLLGLLGRGGSSAKRMPWRGRLLRYARQTQDGHPVRGEKSKWLGMLASLGSGQRDGRRRAHLHFMHEKFTGHGHGEPSYFNGPPARTLDTALSTYISWLI